MPWLTQVVCLPRSLHVKNQGCEAKLIKRQGGRLASQCRAYICPPLPLLAHATEGAFYNSLSIWRDGKNMPLRYRCFCGDSHWQPSWLRPAGFGHAWSRVTRRDAGSAPTSADSRRTPSGTSWWKFEVLLHDCSGTPTGLVDRKITSERHRPQRRSLSRD